MKIWRINTCTRTFTIQSTPPTWQHLGGSGLIARMVKGQVIPANFPRAIKSSGATYATSPQGGDHICGLTIRTKGKHNDPNGQVDPSRLGQITNAGYECQGVCIFAGIGFAATPEPISTQLNARYHWDVDKNNLPELGQETIPLECEFHNPARLTFADDRLPEWMTHEVLASTNADFDVTALELNNQSTGDQEQRSQKTPTIDVDRNNQI